MIHIFAVDPGTRSGVAWGTVGSAGTIKSRLTGAEIRSETVEGPWLKQVERIEGLLYDFTVGMKKTNRTVNVVVEDFILRKFTSDRELLDPVRVTSGLVALIEFQGDYHGRIQYHYQQPALMSSITSDRLRLWDLWLRGSDPALEHQRDARRHLAAFVAEQVRASAKRGETDKGAV